MKRPDVEAILRPLKPFQRRTVDHAFLRLFTAPDSTHRFLVADEVGLGKTLVARGVIARAIDHLWDRSDRIDVVYICSNQSIARSNLPKLRVEADAQQSVALATRLTMLATELAPRQGGRGLGEGRVNFISFTPGTSFNMGHSGGMERERRVLYWLLVDVVSRREGLANLLQGWVGRDRWLDLLGTPLPLEPGIRQRFQAAVIGDHALFERLEAVIERWFLEAPEEYGAEARQARNQITGELRQRLAECCVEALQPDLVILDEFQRFKALINQDADDDDPATVLARHLFTATNQHNEPVRTLLLSATPYKLYTTDAELDTDDHYQDFHATTRFLLGYDGERVATLDSQLSRFSQQLKRAATGIPTEVRAAKVAVEASLRAIMARTERVAASEEHDGMMREASVALSVEPADVRQYLAADAWFRAVGASDPMVYWKAGPYLPHFMQGYRVNDRVEETALLQPEKLTAVQRRYPEAFLERSELSRWREMDPGNAKLRAVVSELLDTGLWRLLWMPPSLPYWNLGGPFQGQEDRTKSLLFSAWNFVPDVVSGVLSYEAERRMMGEALAHYEDPASQRRPLLRFTDQEGVGRSRHRLLLLLVPSLRFADELHPLAAPEGSDVRAWVGERIEAMLAEVTEATSEEAEDPRWEYMAPVVLEPELRAFFRYWAQASDQDTGKPNPEALPHYLDDLANLDPGELGRPPAGLVELLTDVALGAPGVVAARTLASAGLGERQRRARATQIAHAFWNLFNRPAVICLLDQIYGDARQSSDNAHWRRVLRYTVDGNLQAVLDEAWHLYWEQFGWSESEPPEEVARRCVQELVATIEPRPSRVHAQFHEADHQGRLTTETLRIRTTFAQRFGDVRTEQGVISQDAVRSAFNSPFRPFVLTSTSVGQEGLDFHPWCHRLIHWNLPGNPVDLEQREGRVHRYKGHAVRRNVAGYYADAARARWAPSADLWRLLFTAADFAAREAGQDDLVPYWVAPGPSKVERHVPTLPYTREVEAFRRLRRQLAAYRVVFGQPRQEELLAMLDQAGIPDNQLSEWMIRLAPGDGPGEPRDDLSA